MEVTAAEKIEIEKGRILAIIKGNESLGSLTVAQLAEEYSTRHKCSIACYKAEFVSIEAFFKYACGVNIIDEKVCLSTSSTNIASSSEKTNGETSSSVHLVSKPQFSPFFGFSDGNKNKGVAYNVWRFEVESVIKGAFYPDEVILEQIRRSLQGEAKAKIVGFGSETSCESILGKLDQFYSDVGAATGDELLAEAYQMKQGEHEEVAAFASRLDSRVRWAKRRGTEILPDDDSVERQLRMLFWGGIKESIKDKARHKKDNCKTFAELITAARYGEKELGSNQSTRKFARANQAIYQEPGQTSPSQPRNDGDKKEWIAEICSAMAKEVREVLKDQAKPTDARNVGDERKDCDQPRRGWSTEVPTCYRCGQAGHIQIGCRNSPLRDERSSGNERGPLPRGNQRF